MDGLKALLVASLFVGSAYANVEDRFEMAASSTKINLCQEANYYAKQGAVAHEHKMPRELKWMTHEQIMQIDAEWQAKGWKENDPYPLTFTIIRDDGESDKHKEYIEVWFRDGYDHPSDDAFEKCMNLDVPIK